DRVFRAPPPLHPPREGEHLSYEIGAPARAPLEGIEERTSPRVGDGLPEGPQGHQDRGEDVVQIVRDSPGQRPDALEPLRAEELRLDLLLLRDVAHRPHEPLDLTGLVPNGHRMLANPADRPVGADDAESPDRLRSG